VSQLFIESLDDEVIVDESPDFSAGQYSNARASAIGASNVTDLQNFDLSITGRLTTRRGSLVIGALPNGVHPVQGMSYWQVPTAPTFPSGLVVVVNGVLKIWDGASWGSPAAAYGGGVSARVQMVQGIDKLWLAQLGTALKYFDGTTVLAAAGTPPVNPRFIDWHTDRLICSGMPTLPDTLSMSQYLDGNVWDHANWDMRVGAGDGDPITGHIGWSNYQLVVFKQHSVWVVNCDPGLADPATGNISGFVVNPVHRRIGCLAGASAVQVGADVFFLSDSGVRSVSATLASENQKDVGPPLSQPITDWIMRINTAAIDTVVGYYWNNRYMLAVPIDSSTTPNYVLVYNTLTSSWSGYWTGWSATAFARRIHGTIQKLCFGQSTGEVKDFLDYVTETNEVTATFQDDAVDYPSKVISRGFNCGEKDAPKTGLYAKIEFLKSSGTANVSTILDGGAEYAIESFSTDSGSLDLDLELPFDLPTGGILPKSLGMLQFGQWRENQIKIASTAGKLSINRISVGAFRDAPVLEE
jgi:hypothetical protein